MRAWLTGLCVVCAALALGACAGLPSAPPPVAAEELEAGPPLSGEALQQRKRELRRAARDLVHLGATVESLRLHGATDPALVDHVYGYYGEHLDPLLASSTASEDPSLAALAAAAHLLKAELLAELGERSGVERVVRDIERRFAGRDSMLVDYPVGSQTTLREALEFVRRRERGRESGRWARPLPPF